MLECRFEYSWSVRSYSVTVTAYSSPGNDLGFSCQNRGEISTGSPSTGGVPQLVIYAPRYNDKEFGAFWVWFEHNTGHRKCFRTRAGRLNLLGYCLQFEANETTLKQLHGKLVTFVHSDELWHI